MVGLFFMAGSMFFLILNGITAMFQIPHLGKKKEEVERIYRTGVFKEEDEVAKDLKAYFRGIMKLVARVNVSFLFAWIIISLMIKTLVPAWPMWQIMGIVLVFFLTSFGAMLHVYYETDRLRREVMARISQLDKPE